MNKCGVLCLAVGVLLLCGCGTDNSVSSVSSENNRAEISSEYYIESSEISEIVELPLEGTEPGVCLVEDGVTNFTEIPDGYVIANEWFFDNSKSEPYIDSWGLEKTDLSGGILWEIQNVSSEVKDSYEIKVIMRDSADEVIRTSVYGNSHSDTIPQLGIGEKYLFIWGMIAFLIQMMTSSAMNLGI